jgi:hypothetical protein
MPYSSPFIYLKALGHFGASGSALERWNAGVKILHNGAAPTTAQMTAFLTAVAPAFSNWHKSTAINSGTTCFLTGLTGAVIGTDGKYVGGGAQATTVYTYGAPQSGLGTGTLPWSTAMCISLRTQFSRGLSSNGRVYWPCTALPVPPATGVWTPTQCSTAAAEAKILFDAINAASTTGFDSSHRVSVMSQVGAGQAANVTSIRIGGKPDRQERRERDLLETYQSATLALGGALIAENAARPIGSAPVVVAS